jgi:uncharacterized protein with beta-barrel porin domain
MKKLILVFAAIAFSAGAFAQTDLTNRKMSPPELENSHNQHMQNNPVDKSYPDGVVMQNGKLMKVKNGQLTALDQDVTLGNGMKIMTDGNYTKMDGTTTLLEEGQHLDESGNMTVLKKDLDKPKDRNMYLVPDSTSTKDLK